MKLQITVKFFFAPNIKVLSVRFGVMSAMFFKWYFVTLFTNNLLLIYCNLIHINQLWKDPEVFQKFFVHLKGDSAKKEVKTIFSNK